MHAWLCRADRVARGSIRLHIRGYTELAWVSKKACRCITACAELTVVQDGIYKCIRGCAELTGVREGVCGCILGCAELTGM